jgi:uncharacterized protein (DUF1501 family)
VNFLRPELHSRRAFLTRAGQLAATGTALPWALNLAAMGEAAAFNATTPDYKALVCVFLYGGNDHANTVVNYDAASYNQYSSIRGGTSGIALARDGLTATRLNPVTALPGGREYALHPQMSGMAGLFNTNRRAAVQLNVGPLVRPMTRADYNNVAFPRPARLFSHNDQQSTWQSAQAEGSTKGWGGKLGDLALSSQGNSLFTCMSVTGNAVFLSGNSALQYQLSSSTGAVRIEPAKGTGNYVTAAVRDAINDLISNTSSSHRMERAYNEVAVRSMNAEATITSALAGQPASNFATEFAFRPSTPFLDQLLMVARLIAARDTIGCKRQVFLVSLGGFDLHDNLIAGQEGLMLQVSNAMTAFYDATVRLGVADKVTAFTASDFGRTLTSNGDGSDHGWGGHHFIVGGAVDGGKYYGYAPPVSVGNTSSPDDQWHVGQGRLLPSTSVDQYAATLGKWFGANDSELGAIFPTLSNFGGNYAGIDYPRDLGFFL